MKTILSSILVLCLALAGCSHQQAERGKAEAASVKAPVPIAVTAVAAETRRVERFLSVTGSLNPDETVSVSAEVAGRVAAVKTDFGQSVRKGDVLVELDRREYELQLQRAKAALAQALARIGLSPNDPYKPPESTPAIRQATAQLEDAKFKYESAGKLVKTGDISRERYNELEKAYSARQAAVEQMKDDLTTFWMNTEALQAEVKLAEKRLGDTVVRAPFDGSVSARMVSPGQYTKENTPLLTLVKPNPMRLRLEVPESGSASVRIGDTLAFTTEAALGKEFRAVVRELNPSLDAKSRTLTAEARLVTADPMLRPGMFVQVRLITDRNAEIVVVPRSALYTIAGLTKVFVVDGGKAAEKRLTPGMAVGDWVEVPADQVQAGRKVAVSSLERLIEGAPVEVK